MDKNEFDSSNVNEPSVFESSRFYCTLCKFTLELLTNLQNILYRFSWFPVC